MEIDPCIDTGVSTINENIQDLLSGKDYPPSHIARIINRAIEDKRYKAYPGIVGLRKGHFVEESDLFHDFPSADINVKSGGKEIHYPSLTMPSFEGSSVIVGLDDLVKCYDPKTLDENSFYNLLAMVIVVIGSAHAFPDGTGRTAVGLADVLLRRRLGKKLDLKKLQTLDKRLTQAMATGSMLMFPKQYNPNVILESINRGEKRQISIPRKGTHPINQVQSYAKEYAQSILEHIQNFNPNEIDGPYLEPFSLERDSIKPIASLLKEVSVE